MAHANYRVIQSENGGFYVEVTRTGAVLQMTTGFPSEVEADAWIAQDKRLRDAADPFRTPAGRSRRTF